MDSCILIPFPLFLHISFQWTREEEMYVVGLTAAFKAGVVPIPNGTTLRVFLSSMLNCPAKRISKKFVGTNYNGKQIYIKKEDDEVDAEIVAKHHTRLQELEQDFIKSMKPFFDFQELTTKRECDITARRVHEQQEQFKAKASDLASAKLLASLHDTKVLKDLLKAKRPETFAAEALMKSTRVAAMRRLTRMRLLSSEGVAARDARHQLATNTQALGPNNDAILRALLQERLTSSMISFPLLTPMPSAPGGGKASMLMGGLKRKFENQATAPTAAKRAQN